MNSSAHARRHRHLTIAADRFGAGKTEDRTKALAPAVRLYRMASATVAGHKGDAGSEARSAASISERRDVR